jgi:imidazolonepropionase-like amidohydrolase
MGYKRSAWIIAVTATVMALPLAAHRALAHDDMFGMAAAQAAPAPTPQVQTIHAGRLITDTDVGITGPATITVTDGRISAIVQGLQPAPAGAQLIDLSTRTVMPGLIDMHVHLTGDPSGEFWREAVDPDEWGVILGVRNAQRTVRAGFTTVRDAGSARQAAFVLRRGTDQGVIAGPRIVAAGPALSIVGGHGDITGFRREVIEALPTGFTCTGPIECALRVRQASAAGSDVIKITATGGVLSQQGRGLEAHFTAEEMTSIAATAHSLGLRVMAHAHGARGIEAAARAGIDTIDHGTFMDEAAARVMRERGTFLVPTLRALTGVRDGLGRGIYTPTVEAKIRETLEVLGNNVRLARRFGIPVAFGTDAGVFPHGLNGEEFQLLIDAGMTPREAVASATITAARALGMESQIGRIAVGYSADIIAVDGNPLESVTPLARPQFVMVRGRVQM